MKKKLPKGWVDCSPKRYRVWHAPQMPMPAFTVDVASPADGKRILNILARYDLFQFENGVKGDYSNAAGLSVFDPDEHHDGPDGSWVDWTTEDGDDIDMLAEEELKVAK